MSGPDARLIKDPAEMTAWAEAVRTRGERIALVPTMGFLHEGHISLLEMAGSLADRVVISIFVNPIQFGPGEDLARYPRDLGGDLAKASRAGTDIAFVPESAKMYPQGFQTFIRVRELERGLCGDRRPEHFSGVATIVCKLFNVVRPHVAIFGEKDFQQLAVIRRMVRDLDIPVEITGGPTVREADGLAMSSRNVYLNPSERRRATALYRGLRQALLLWQSGERGADKLLQAARSVIEAEVDRLDYLELRDADTLAPAADADQPSVMLVAAYLGTTRLIDNIRLG